MSTQERPCICCLTEGHPDPNCPEHGPYGVRVIDPEVQAEQEARLAAMRKRVEEAGNKMKTECGPTDHPHPVLPPDPLNPSEKRLRLAWHDVTCPEAEECPDRDLHAMSAPLVTSGVLRRFLELLSSQR